MQLRVVQLATLAAAAAAYRVPLAPLPAPTLATARPLPLAALSSSPRLAPPRCVASSPELDDKTLDAGALGRSQGRLWLLRVHPTLYPLSVAQSSARQPIAGPRGATVCDVRCDT